MDDAYESTEEDNLNKEHKILHSNKKLLQIVTELFIRGRKLVILVFITESYLISAVQKTIRLHSTHYFIMKIPKKRELQQILLHRIIFYI